MCRTELNFDLSATKPLRSMHVCIQKKQNSRIDWTIFQPPLKKFLHNFSSSVQIQKCSNSGNDNFCVPKQLKETTNETTKTPEPSFSMQRQERPTRLQRPLRRVAATSVHNHFPATLTFAELSLLGLPLAQKALQYPLSRRTSFNLPRPQKPATNAHEITSQHVAGNTKHQLT